MRAVQFSAFGGPEVLHVEEIAEPRPGPGQVRIRVKAAGVNPIDSKIRSGAMRAMFPMRLPATIGFEAAGVIDAIGSEVTTYHLGDEVMGWTDTGAYAELALATTVVRKPALLAWDKAVALPVAGEASNRVLGLLAIGMGDVLLIHGGAGAVGTLAIQLALRRGARVIATANPRDLDYVRTLGAIGVSYGEGLASRIRALHHHIDAVFDAAGKGALPGSIELRGGKTRIITIADPDASSLGIPFSTGTPRDRDPFALQELAGLVVSGAVAAVVGATFPLVDVQRAHEQVTAGGHRGKIVLAVS
jgi:NADPH:quinone reductase-like Zn-dependent oxidoreductase